MKYLIDSDCVIDYLNGCTRIVEAVTRVRRDLLVSVITVGEDYDGIYYGDDPQRRALEFRRFLELPQVVPVNEAVAMLWARRSADLRRTGIVVPDADFLIASTAAVHGAVVITRNVKDFKHTGAQLFDI